MTTNELQQKYNKTLKLLSSGCIYMDDPDISIESKEKVQPVLQKLISRTNNILFEIQQQVEPIADEHILEGF